MILTSPRSVPRWRAHHVAASFLRVCGLTLPILSGYVAASFVAASLGPPDAGAGLGLWWLAVLGSAVAGGFLIEHFTRRLLPLAALLRLELEFPERAPLRTSVLQRAEDAIDLRRRVTQASVTGSHDFQEASEVSISALVGLSQHDRAHKGHSERVRAYSDLIATAMHMTPADQSRLRWAALLHDIGKLSLPVGLVNKKQLNLAEQESLHSHAMKGSLLVAPMVDWLGPWAEAIGHHHERWDGDGYPDGLAGREIPLAARIVAVADAYDQMTSGQWPGPRLSHAAARRQIGLLSGSSFDPTVVRAFMHVKVRRMRWAAGPLTGLADRPWLAPLGRAGGTLVTLGVVVAFTATASLSGALLPAPDLSAIDAERAMQSILDAIGMGEDPPPRSTTTAAPATTTTQATTTLTLQETTTTAELPFTTTTRPGTSTTSTSSPTTTSGSTSSTSTSSPTSTSTTTSTSSTTTTSQPTTGIVPMVVGLTEPEANAAIVGAGFVVGAVTNQPDIAPAGQVIDQNPVAGVLRPLGSSIDIVVSSGPATTTTMPTTTTTT